MKAWEDKIRRVVPYTPGEQPKRPVIKLNTNECPYPPSPSVEQAMRALDADTLRLYPDTEALPLVKALSAAYGVVSRHHLFLLRCVGRIIPHPL